MEEERAKSQMRHAGLLSTLDDRLFPRLAPCVRLRARVHLFVLAILAVLIAVQILRVLSGEIRASDGIGLPDERRWAPLTLPHYIFISIWIWPLWSVTKFSRRMRRRDVPCGVCGYALSTVHSIACPECGVPQERRRLRRYYVECRKWWMMWGPGAASFENWQPHGMARKRFYWLLMIQVIGLVILVVWYGYYLFVAVQPLSLPMLCAMIVIASVQMLWFCQWSPWKDDPAFRRRPPHWEHDVVIPSYEAWKREQQVIAQQSHARQSEHQPTGRCEQSVVATDAGYGCREC